MKFCSELQMNKGINFLLVTYPAGQSIFWKIQHQSMYMF